MCLSVGMESKTGTPHFCFGFLVRSYAHSLVTNEANKTLCHLFPVVAEQMQASADAGLHSAPKSQPDSEPPENAKAEEGTNQTATATPQNSSSQKSAIPSELFSHSASSLSSHYGLPTSLAAGTGDREGRGLGPSFPLAGLPSYSASPLATGVSGTDLSLRHAAMLQEEIMHLREANRQVGRKRMQYH